MWSTSYYVTNNKYCIPTANGGRDYASTGSGAKSEVPPVTKAFQDLMALQKEGKIKHIGASNFGVQQLKEALATGVTIAC